MSPPELMHHSGWPWPLDTVQDWFDSLWDSIKGWIDGVAQMVWDIMPKPLKDLSVWLAELTLEIFRKILAFFKDPIGTLKAAFDWVINFIREHVGWWDPVQGRFVGGFLGWLWDILNLIGKMIADAAGWAWQQIAPVVGGIAEGLKGFIDWVWKGLQDIGAWITKTVWGWIEGSLKWLTDTFRWLRDEVAEVGGWIITGVTTAFDGAVAGIATSIGEALVGIGTALGEAFQGVIDFFWTQLPAALGMVWEFLDKKVLTPIWQGLQWLWNWITDRVMGVVHAVEDLFKGKSPITPEEAANLWPWVLAAAAGLGLAATGITSVAGIKILGTGLEVGEIGSYVKDLLSPGMFVGATLGTLIGVGLTTPLRYYYQKALTPLIPPIPDLIRFVVREVILPETFYDLVGYHGYSKERARWFWDAHWILPAFGNVVDAYHRGAITSEELDKFLVWHDYSPTPRPGIEKTDVEIMRSVLKTLIPRVDLRYAWELGRLTDEELVAWYERLGYEEDSPLMAEIQMARSLVEEMHKVRDEWIRDYVDGFIDEDVLRANLAEIGIGPRRIDYYVIYAAKRRDRERLRDLLDLYRDGFMKDLITEEELRDRVLEIIIIPEVADLFVEKAYVDKYKKPKPPTETTEEKAAKELNKYKVTYAIQAYRRYAIEKDTLVTLLIEAGVDPAVARTRADYEELKRPIPKPPADVVAAEKEKARIQKLEEAKAIEEYRADLIDEGTLLKRLLEIGYSEALAAAITQFEIIRKM